MSLASFCDNCGLQFQSNETFCSRCGASRDMNVSDTTVFLVSAPPTAISPILCISCNGPVGPVSWSPDGKYLAAGQNNYSDDKAYVYVQQSLTERVIWWFSLDGDDDRTYTAFAYSRVCSVSWSMDSKYLTVGWTTYKFKVVATYEFGPRKVIARSHNEAKGVTRFPSSPDGKYLVSQRKEDLAILIHEALSSRLVYECLGHIDRVNSVSWSPDGKYLASGSFDKTVRVWEMRS